MDILVSYWLTGLNSSIDGVTMPKAHTVSQWEEKMDIQWFFTGKEVEAEAVAQTSSHAEQGKQGL